jgi:chromosome segregation ATPase
MFVFWPFSYQQPKYKSAEDRLREQLTTLEQVNGSLLAQANDFKELNDSLTNDVNGRQLEIDRLKSEFTTQKVEWQSNYNRMVNDLVGKGVALQREVEQLQVELHQRNENVKRLQESLAASISERDTMDTCNRGLSSDVERLHGEAILLKSDISKYRAIFQSNTELLVSTHNELKDYKDAVDTLVRFHQSKQPNQPSA